MEIHGSTVSRALKVEGGRRDHAPKGGNLSRTIETRNTGHEEPARGYEGTRTGEETGPRRGQDAPSKSKSQKSPTIRRRRGVWCVCVCGACGCGSLTKALALALGGFARPRVGPVSCVACGCGLPWVALAHLTHLSPASVGCWLSVIVVVCLCPLVLCLLNVF